MKKILTYSAVFICSLMFFIWVFFPYQSVVSHYTEKAINENRVPISYSQVNAGMYRAVYQGVVMNAGQRNAFQIGDVTVQYSVLSLLTRSISFGIEGRAVSLSGDLSASRIDFELAVNTGEIAVGEKSNSLNGAVLGRGNIDFNADSGTLRLTSDKLVVKSDFGPITLSDLKGEAAYKKRVLTVTDFSSQGKTRVSVTGKIFINSKNVMLSRLQLKGKLDLSGLKQNVNISGTLDAPRISVK